MKIMLVRTDLRSMVGYRGDFKCTDGLNLTVFCLSVIAILNFNL